jgi:antirestriction protein ArdC
MLNAVAVFEIDGRKPRHSGPFLCAVQLGADVPQQEVRVKTTNLYDIVTGNIIAELQAGAVPWLKPWKGGGTGHLPANAITKRSYSGINIMLLWYEADIHSYPTHLCLTYQQAKAQGATVRKGQKGTHIVFTKPLLVKDRETEDPKKIQMLKTFCVFNIAQIDGLPDQPEPEERSEPIRHEAAEAFIKATDADIRMGGDKACYIPALDYVLMPFQGFFIEQDVFYAVTLHELGHWTGAKHRLARDLSGQFINKKYAFEELVAELTSAFLCAHLGLKAELRHAGYIEHYLEVLKDDDRAFFRAAAKAQQAADFLRAFGQPVEETE